MGGKVVVSVISIVLVVGVVIGVVAVVYSGRSDVWKVNEQEKLSASMKAVHTLCEPATYKDACIKSLGTLATQNDSATPQDIVLAGVKMALEETAKAFNFTDKLEVPKDSDPRRTHDAIKACKEQLDSAMDRLNEVIHYVGRPEESYKSKFLVWDMRLSLSDANNFITDCVDEFMEAEASELANTMKDGIAAAANLSVSMLDIITVFHNALSQLNLNDTQLEEASKSWIQQIANQTLTFPSPNRRLLQVAGQNSYGMPAWTSDMKSVLTNIHLMNERKLAGAGAGTGAGGNNNAIKKKGKGKGKGKKGRGKKAAAAAAVGAVGAVGGAAAISTATPVGAGAKPAPNAVVPSPQYKTIMDAVKAHPGMNLKGRWVIYVKAGIYKEDVLIEKQHINIMIYGDGPTATVVTGNKNFGNMKIQTMYTAPFQVDAAGFFCKDMGFENTAGPPGHQAVAFRIKGKFGVFQNCKFDAYQDTLYTQGGSQFFRDCQISGTVDFIFGDGATLIQNSIITVRKGDPGQRLMVTAEGGTAPNAPTGIVFQGCKILPDRELVPVKSQFPVYLGRPWKPYCRTVFMESELSDIINPEGYYIWDDKASPNNHKTAFYGEFNNYGPGANTAARVKWPHVKVLTKVEAQRWTAANFLEGDLWIKDAGVPV